MTNPYATAPGPRTPRWARKRYVLPALALSLFTGVTIGGNDPKTEPTATKPRPTVTVTTTATTTETPTPEPATTVTATETVKVTRTVTAPAKANTDSKSEDTSDDTSDDSANADVYYDNCTAARAAGAAPVHAGDPGYGRHLDRDGDGVGCE
ncbi:excalibur calcium-binding domain-containing protein [Streptomyces sp. NPDC002920]